MKVIIFSVIGAVWRWGCGNRAPIQEVKKDIDRIKFIRINKLKNFRGNPSKASKSGEFNFPLLT